MKTLAARWKRLIRHTPTLSSPWGGTRPAGVEQLEARIAPATLAALPGNASFEETLDFAKWTINPGPGSLFLEYQPANIETTVVRGSLAPEGDAYAHLSFEGRVVSGTEGFGPSLQSETFSAAANDQISVTWRATNNGDTAHPRGRLFTADGTAVATFFDADTGTTAWATRSVTAPSSGEYYLLFEIGSTDNTIGGTIGAKLDIDAVHRRPSGVAVTTLGNSQLSVEVSGESRMPNAPNDFLINLDRTGQFLQIFVNGSLDFLRPLALVDEIKILGLAGADHLTVDSSQGLIALANGIHFDGGGASNTLSLIQSGGSTRLSDTFSVGTTAGEGTSAIDTQIVSFVNVGPVLDNVPATSFTVNGTAAANVISSVVGAGGGSFAGATARITIDTLASIEFNQKTALTLNALGGGDTISLNNPTLPVGLAQWSVHGGDPTSSPGDTLRSLLTGAIHPTAAGLGTITAPGALTINFTGFEVVTTAGFNVTPGVAGLVVTAVGDRTTPRQADAFAVATDATQFLTVALNGSIGLYATQSAIASIQIDGAAGQDSLTLTGTALAETLTYDPSATDAGDLSLTGVPPIQYTATESIILNAGGGNDTFLLKGGLGTVKLIGGSGSDTADFSGAASRIVFDLDAVGVDQFLNATGQIVNLGDVIENFVGTSFNDTVRVNAATFPRDLKAGAPGNVVFPPGDELFFDGLQGVVNTVRSSPSTGVHTTVGYADVTFAGFDSSLIENSPSGPGFGTPGNSAAFQPPVPYSLLRGTSGGLKAPGSAPEEVVTADLNGDGFPDMVTANKRTANVSVLLNNGDGTFGAPISYKTRGLDPQHLVVGNFDASPGLDLAVTNTRSNTLAILSGNSVGGFATATLIKTTTQPFALAVGRVNDDVIDDLVIVHPLRNTMSLLLGTGTGFAPAVLFKTVGRHPVDVAIGDFNHDGKADVVTANFVSNNVSYFQGNGLGSFAAPTRFATGKNPRTLAVADFDLDGAPDLVVGNWNSFFLSVLFSNGAGSAETQFDPQFQIALPGKRASASIATGDLNGDGFFDVVFTRKGSKQFTVLLGDGLGKFSLPYEFELGQFGTVQSTAGLALADLNKDGLLDIVATSITTAETRVILRKI